MNTLVREGEVIRKIYSKKESYSLVQTNEHSVILIIKEELQNLKAELCTFNGYVMADLLEMKQNNNKCNKNSRSVMNITGDEFVSSQGENVNLITVKHFQDEIKFSWDKVRNKNEIIKTILENINCLKKQFSENQNFFYNSYQKSLKRQNQNINSQDDSSFITLTKKIKSNKKNINKSNKIDNDIDFVSLNRYAPLENIDESLNSSSADNLLQSEINAATQDQVNNNCHRHEGKKALIIGHFMVKGIKRWKINKKLKFTNVST